VGRGRVGFLDYFGFHYGTQRMRQSRKLRFLIPAVAAALLASGGLFAWHVAHVLRAARLEVRSEGAFSFLVRRYDAPPSSLFETVSAPAVFREAAPFQGHLYIAGPAGLFEYDSGGTPLRSFSSGRELPPSPLIALASTVLADSHQSELILATEQEGLLAFDGRAFRQILPRDSEVRAITAILPVRAGHLLIGTKRKGVLLFDGQQIIPLHASFAGIYVTALAGDEEDLWVGTLDRGVLHWHAGMTESFSEEQGLPDRQVQSLEISKGRVFVGTAAGVAEFDRDRLSQVVAPGLLATALLAMPQNLLVGTEDQGLQSIALDGHKTALPSGASPALSEVRQIFRSGDAVFVLTRNALYRTNARGLGWEPVLTPGPAALSDRNISALAADSTGRVWVGYFDRGLDILSLDASRAMHIEDDRVFCVNRILPDAKSATTMVATANGLVRLGATGQEEQVLTHADGLIADHITDVAFYRDGLAIATPSGLTFLDSGGARSLYAFHGLVNNHVYALAVSGDELLAGTLGGVSMIDREQVRGSYSTSNSALKHNWITAIVPVGDEWMVGTYGGGIVGLDRHGRFRALDAPSAPVVVNPNAMLATEHHVFAGTLGHGLFVFDRQSARWRLLTEGQPSSSVTALTEANGYIYVGTDNGLVRIEESKLHP
jgi:ligand-binding sensor domain-containing protein